MNRNRSTEIQMAHIQDVKDVSNVKTAKPDRQQKLLNFSKASEGKGSASMISESSNSSLNKMFKKEIIKRDVSFIVAR